MYFRTQFSIFFFDFFAHLLLCQFDHFRPYPTNIILGHFSLISLHIWTFQFGNIWRYLPIFLVSKKTSCETSKLWKPGICKGLFLCVFNLPSLCFPKDFTRICCYIGFFLLLSDWKKFQGLLGSKEWQVSLIPFTFSTKILFIDTAFFVRISFFRFCWCWPTVLAHLSLTFWALFVSLEPLHFLFSLQTFALCSISFQNNQIRKVMY